MKAYRHSSSFRIIAIVRNSYKHVEIFHSMQKQVNNIENVVLLTCQKQKFQTLQSKLKNMGC